MRPLLTANFAGKASLLLLIPMIAFGCGTSDEMNRQAVSGTVSLAGNPIPSGLIEFSPMGAEGISSGASITEGEYSIPTDKGLPPGDYLIRIYSAGTETEEASEMPGEAKLKKELVPDTYNTNSKETRTVSASEKNVFDFEIPSVRKGR